MRKYIHTFENHINEKMKVNTDLYSIKYSVNIFGEIGEYSNRIMSDDGFKQPVDFLGKLYYITDIQGTLDDDNTDINVTLENEDEEIYLQWKGRNGRHKANIDDLGWVNTNYIKRHFLYTKTLAKHLVFLIDYVVDKYTDEGFVRDKVIGENNTEN